MPKKDAAAEKAKDQIKRFKEKARELGVNEDPEAFDAAVGRVIGGGKKVSPDKSG